MNLSDKKQVYQADLYGLRDKKYRWLNQNDITTVDYPEVSPISPYYFFIQRDVDNIAHYLEWMKINDIFPVNSVGIVTARDKLTIGWSEQEIWNRVLNFSKYDTEFARQVYNLGKDVRDWKVDFAQADLKESGLDREKIKPILYRPFDIRYTYYTGKSRGFHCMPRPEVMGHMQKDNLGLTIGRQGHVVGENQIWNLAYVSTSIIDFNLFYRGGALLLPLYLYIDDSNRDLFNQTIGKRKTNIPKSIIDKLTGIYGGVFTPEKIVSYIYGILYSTTYRTKYEDFLKIDFPRIPFSAKPEVFFSISALGQRLINLHLLKGQEIDKPTIKFNGHGDDIKIFRPHYHDTEKRVFINEDYFFDNVEEVVWNYHIGGYQVLYKYLKDRKGRRMDDPRHYIRIATAIEKTIEIQKEIDALYPEVEKDVIEF